MPGKTHTNGDGNSTAVLAPGNGMSSAQAMRKLMDLEATTTETSNNAAEEIQNAILSADNDAAVFGAAEAGLLSGKELVNVPMSILDYDLVKSAIADSSMPVYAKVKAVRLDTGEPFVFSIGGDSSLAQLFQFNRVRPFTERRDGLRCAIASRKTAAGYEVLWFRPLTAAEDASAAALSQS